MKIKLQKINPQADEKFLWLKRINVKSGDKSTMSLNTIIKIINPKSDIFKHDDNYYHINDFLKIIIYDNNNNELLLSDYDFIDFDKVSEINEVETITIAKDIKEIGCRIKRLYTDTHIEGITVSKPTEDFDDDTIAYQYYLSNGTLSGINISSISSNEWFSIDQKTVAILKPITKITHLLTIEDNDCHEILSKIRQIVFKKQ